jgi:hypothetical protein
LDLHGYDIHTAVDLALQCVEAAWEHGFSRLSVLHGAAKVTSPSAATARGRGAIKWAIRGALDDGEFDAWALPPRSEAHRRASRSSETSIALKPNPDPHPDAAWPTIPQPDHW